MALTLAELTKFTGGEKVFTREIEDFIGFSKLADLEEKKAYYVIGAYVKRGGKYGDEPCVVLSNSILTLPKHKLPIIEQFATSPEIVEQINRLELFITPYSYKDKDGLERYSCNFMTLSQVGEQNYEIATLATCSNPKKEDK